MQHPRDLPVTVWIGKKGANESIISEIKKQFQSRKLIKIKVLKNSPSDFSEIIAEVVKNTNSRLVEKKGKTIILSKIH